MKALRLIPFVCDRVRTREVTGASGPLNQGRRVGFSCFIPAAPLDCPTTEQMNNGFRQRRSLFQPSSRQVPPRNLADKMQPVRLLGQGYGGGDARHIAIGGRGVAFSGGVGYQAGIAGAEHVLGAVP